MRTDYRLRGRVLTALVALTVGIAAILAPDSADAQRNAVTLETCKKVELRGHVYGSEVLTRQCGNTFGSSDAYIAVVVHLQNIAEYTTVLAELFDPDQSSVWKRTPTYQPDAGRGWSDIWIWAVLPVAADLAALGAENTRLPAVAIRLEGKPARERPGEWTLRAQLNRSAVQVAKFRLLAP